MDRNPSRTLAGAIAVITLMGACRGNDDATSPVSQATEQEPVGTDPAPTDPPATQPPVDEPSDTDPPTTETPASEPSALPEPASETTAPAAAGEVVAATYRPETRSRECVDLALPEATCYWVDVPADWSAPDGDTIALPVTVLAASDADVRPDPVVIPAGGPGAAIATAYGLTDAPLNAERDIVLYDQRGAGLAEPSLDCPELIDARVANLQRAAEFEIELEAVLDAFTACHDRLVAAGIDFDDYDTEASVLDLDAIRTALGYEQWNIVGISYGGRLALAAMRSTPDGIRAAILDSVAWNIGGLARGIEDGEAAYRVLADACAEDAQCAADHGDLAAAIDTIYQQWEAVPIEVEVDLDDGAGLQTFVITGSDALAGLGLAMSDAPLIPLLPAVISSWAAGETVLVEELVRMGVPALTELAEAMNISVHCADNAGLDDSGDEAARADHGRQAIVAANIVCAEWPVEPTSPAFNDPVASEIPVLALAGRFDPQTPPAMTEAAIEHLSNATYVLFPGAAHGALFAGGECSMTMAKAFLDAPDAQIDRSCVDSIAPVNFS